MPINPNIAMGYRPVQLENPMNAMAQMSQIQNYQQTNQLNQMKMEEARRGMQEDEAVRNYFAQNPDRTAPTFGQGLYGVSPKQGMAFGKYQAEQDTASSARDKARSDLLTARLDQSKRILGQINPNSPSAGAAYMAWHRAQHSDSVIGPALTQFGVKERDADASIEAAIAQGPQALANMINQSVMGVEKFMTMNKPMTVAPGSSVFQDGKFTTAPESTGTESTRNFNAAVAGGYKGSFVQYQAEIAKAGRTPATAPAAQLHTDPESGAVWERDRNGVWKQAVGPGGQPVGSRKVAPFEDMDKARAQYNLEYPISMAGMRMNNKTPGKPVPEFNAYYQTEWPIAKQVAGIGGVARTPATARDTGVLPIGQGTTPRTPSVSGLEQEAIQAIKDGRDKEAVKKRYKQLTGKDLGGV